MKVTELFEGEFPKGSSRIKEFSEQLCEFLNDAGFGCYYQGLYGRVWSRSTGGKYRDPQHSIKFKSGVDLDKAWAAVVAQGKPIRLDVSNAPGAVALDAVKVGKFIVTRGTAGAALFIQGVDILKNTTIRSVKEDRYEDKWAKDLAAQNRAKAQAAKPAKPARQPAPKKQPIDLAKVWSKVEHAISNSFPDGDPIDHLPRDVDMDVIDKAVKQFAGRGKAKYGLYDYLADMWADSQGDAVYDANVTLNKGEIPEHSPFYDVVNFDKGGFTGKEKVVKTPNPWR